VYGLLGAALLCCGALLLLRLRRRGGGAPLSPPPGGARRKRRRPAAAGEPAVPPPLTPAAVVVNPLLAATPPRSAGRPPPSPAMRVAAALWEGGGGVLPPGWRWAPGPHEAPLFLPPGDAPPTTEDPRATLAAFTAAFLTAEAAGVDVSRFAPAPSPRTAAALSSAEKVLLHARGLEGRQLWAAAAAEEAARAAAAVPAPPAPGPHHARSDRPQSMRAALLAPLRGPPPPAPTRLAPQERGFTPEPHPEKAGVWRVNSAQFK
jgi:hypothetical protein